MQFDKIKTGTILSCTMYLEVLSKDKTPTGHDYIIVKDNFGRQFEVRGKELIEQSMNANDQYDKEETVSMTKAAEELIGSGDAVWTVDFIKKDGSQRTLVGRWVNEDKLLGRSNVYDLLIKSGNPLRQVDHRNINSLILRGTKYNVK